MEPSGLKILAIDDTPDNLVALRAVLAEALPGATLFTAHDGRRGVELARAQDPDVVLLDIVMPVMDGFAVCRQLKADARLRDIPVVFLTALHTDRTARIEALDVGAEGFLSKPPDEQELTAQIRAMARLKAGARIQRLEKEELEARVQQRTQQLAQELNERRRAEVDRERLATAIEQAAETIVVTDPQGFIVYANPAFEAASGYTRAEAIGQNPRIVKSGVQGDEFYSVLWETIAAGRIWKGQIVNRRKDGRLFTEEATISPVRNSAGAITSYVAVKRDITRDLMLEAQLLQSQKMESIGRLAGGVAHDFNNILAVILTSTAFALETVKEEGSLRNDILEIQEAGERAAALTRQLLAFSRKQIMKVEPIALNSLIDGLEKMLKRVIGEDIDLVKDLAPDLGVVRADPGQIEQVIMNLAVNARDAMPEGGTLTIRTRNVKLEAEAGVLDDAPATAPRVLLEVVDTGVGMDGPTKAMLFEPFFTTKERGKGTGLGLPTVYGIVTQSGGNIRVWSEPGKGTVVSVFLPPCSSPATDAPRPLPAAKLTGTETVLVVEDDASVRSLCRRMLVSAGYTALVAEDGCAALTLCKNHPGDIQIVLSDVVMPQMSGRAFGERLAEVRPGARILFMSGYTDDAIGRQGILEPGVNFIAKPFSQEELLRAVRALLDRNPTPSEGQGA